MKRSLIGAAIFAALAGPSWAGTCDGDPGFSITAPSQVLVGDTFTIELEAPSSGLGFFFIAFDQGSVRTKFGELCLDLSDFYLYKIPFGQDPLEIICDLECDDAFAGLKLYMQFILFKPGQPELSGISNLATIEYLQNPDCGATEWCVENSDGDEEVSCLDTDAGFYFYTLDREYDWEDGATLIERLDGSASLSGSIRHRFEADKCWDVEIDLAGRMDPAHESYPPDSSPYTYWLKDSALLENGGPVDTDTWWYYTESAGTLIGCDHFEGASISMIRYGPAFQFGHAANLYNSLMGGGAWFTGILTTPDGSMYDLGIIDLGFDLTDCE